MENLKKFINDNAYIITVLYIVLLLILLLILLDEKRLKKILLDHKYLHKNKEDFSNSKKTIVLHNILMENNDNDTDSNKEEGKQRYFSSILIPKTKNNNNFVYTNAIDGNKWKRDNENGLLCDKCDDELDNKYIVFDLTYDKDKKLMAVGLKMVDGKPVYDIFKKKSTDWINSKWTRLESNNKIRSLSFDLQNGRMIGCSSYDGQIYETRFNNSLKEWIGPINYDIPMRKVMYDKDGYMIGIGLIDNFIYRKKSIDWRISKWDKKNVNKTKVYDLIYDFDGCFIATSSKGLLKQTGKDFNSPFVLFKNFDSDNKKFAKDFNANDILKYKIGYEFIENMFDDVDKDDSGFGASLRKIYDFKKLTKDLCRTKVIFEQDKIHDNVDIQSVNKNNEEITDLYSKINLLSKKLDI